MKYNLIIGLAGLMLFPLTLFCQNQMAVTTHTQEAKETFLRAREVLSLVWVTGGIEELEEAIALDSTLAIAHVYRGISNAFLGKDRVHDFNAAKRHAKNATEGERQMIEGWIHFFSGNLDSAEIAYSRVVALHPEDDYARHILGDVYRLQDRYEDALRMMKPLVTRKNAYIPAFNHIAYTYRDMGMMDSCMAYMQYYIKANPKNANAYHSMGEIYLARGASDMAQLYFYNAFMIDPYFAAAAKDLGDLFVIQKKYDLARAAYLTALERATRLYGEKFISAVEQKLASLPQP